MRDSQTYPQTRREDVSDTYQSPGGAVTVPDPYRWLEDPQSPETRAWVAAQNRLSDEFFAGVGSRAEYLALLNTLWDYPKAGTPLKKGGRYFREFNPGLRDQPLWQVADTPRGPWRDLLDPGSLSDDGTVSVASVAVSDDGALLAYGTQSGGSDWLTWRVREVASGQDRDDTVRWSKFSGATWLPDGSGFFYSAYAPPGTDEGGGEALTAANRGQRLMLHRLGAASGEDEVVLERPDEPDWGFRAQITPGGQHLVVTVWRGTSPKNQLWVRPLAGGEWTELVGEFRAAYTLIGAQADTLYLRTDEDAPRGKVIAWNLQTGERHTVISEGEDKLEHVTLAGGHLLAVTLRDASHRLSVHALSGERRRELTLPSLGSVTALNGEPEDQEAFFGFTGFLSPPRAHRLELPDGEPEALESELGGGASLPFDASDFEVTQEFATSKDGTRIPMFIVSKKGLVRNGENPTLLYGYGGFGVSLTPGFSPARLAWLARGGVFVQANLRGGGEYGEAWHQAGTLEHKQNVFDDLYACAEHLIERGVTRPGRLGLDGRSNGGLLVGAAMTQRPELFGAVTPQVGVLDMLRYHRFTIGWAWASDYGRSDDPEMFAHLHAYSPLHNLREGAHYPPTLVTTGDHDDRVVPAHSYKFTAELQRVQGGNAPALLRVQTRAGHGAGKPTSLLVEEAADVWSFFEHHLMR